MFTNEPPSVAGSTTKQSNTIKKNITDTRLDRSDDILDDFYVYPVLKKVCMR